MKSRRCTKILHPGRAASWRTQTSTYCKTNSEEGLWASYRQTSQSSCIFLFSKSPAFHSRPGEREGSILYCDRQSSQIPIENTSAWQLLDYLTLISLPPSIHSSHWLHFSIYFAINVSGLTEQSSDESAAQSISPTLRVLIKKSPRA